MLFAADRPYAATAGGAIARGRGCYASLIPLPTPPYTLFLLSPANLAGERGQLVFNPRAEFPLARALRSPQGAPLGEVFAFISGLYFRGKKIYAETFGRPPPGLSGGLVISAGEGLRFLHEPVTLERLRRWADVDIDAGNRRFVEPLVEHAVALERAHGAETRLVLLGSVASDKYVVPLTRVFGDHLLFPSDFVGRGDMSRGALLLRAARAGQELAYAPVEGAVRHGGRAPGVAFHPLDRLAARSRAPGPSPSLRGGARAATEAPPARASIAGSTDGPELAVLVGLPGAGKSTFFAQRFASSHLQVSKDLLRNNRQPARRQLALLAEALAAGRSVVVDNTNASRAERAELLAQARAAGAPARAYFFDCPVSDCLARNAGRMGPARIPRVGIFATAKRLERPTLAEGFDRVFIVRPVPGPAFEVHESD